MTKPIWTERNKLLKKFNIENKNVIDFGCGDKSVCQYINFHNYIGIDKIDSADIKIDFDKNFSINIEADVGLILGVLEYLDDPSRFIRTISSSCKKFIILVLAVKAPKTADGWKRAYNQNSFENLLKKHFDNYTIHKEGKYLIGEVNI